MKIAKSRKLAKSLMAAAIVALAASTNANASNSNTKSARALDPEVKVMPGVTKTNQYGFMFKRHPLLTGVHALEVQGGTIMLSGEKLEAYRETEGPLVGFYCYSVMGQNGDTLCREGEGSYIPMEKYAEQIGLRPYVRYNNTFQDPYGNEVEAVVGCSKKFTQKQCEDYVGEEYTGAKL